MRRVAKAHPPRPWMAPLSLFALALAMRVTAILIGGFDGLYSQDSYEYFNYARQMRLALEGTPLAGPFYWPLGYPALAGLAFLLTGITTFGAQAASVLTGAALAPLAYWMVLELPVETDARGHAATAAGLIMAVSGQLLQSSILIMADAAGLFWAALAVLMLLRFGRTRAIRWLVWAAAALALATVTRWIFAGLLIPFGVYLLINLRREPARVAVAGLALGLLFALIVLPQVAFSQTSGAPVLEHGWVTGWDLRHAYQTAFDNPDGHFVYRFPPAFFYAQPLFHPFYLFPLLTPLALFAAWLLRRSPSLVLLAGWPLVLYVYLIGVPYENFRFGLAYFPPFAMLAAVGLYTVLPGHWWAFNEAQSLLLRHILLGVSLAGMAAFGGRSLGGLFATKQAEFEAVRYLETHVPSGATMITFGRTLLLDHYTDFETVELFRETPDTLRARICEQGSGPMYVFVDPPNIRTQWAGRAPNINFRWLQDSIGLLHVGRLGTWTLYEIEGGCPD